MYAQGISQRNIFATIDDIYDFKLSAEQIPKITDRSIPSFSSTASSCPLSAITKQKSAPFITFWGFRSTGARKFWSFGFKREQTRLDADFRRTQGARRSGSWLHFYGQGVMFGRGSTSNFPRSGCATLHFPPDSQLSKVCPDARLQGLHRSLEKNLRCTKPQSLPRRIRAFLTSLE